MAQQNSWEEGRPIYKRLPAIAEQYVGNPVVDAITLPWDEVLMQSKLATDNFYTNFLNPTTALSQNLDWLAQLCGFVGEYWDSSWSDAIKRTLIANSYSYIWVSRGTRACLQYLFSVFGLPAKIVVIGDFYAGITTLPAQIGGGNFQFFVTVPLSGGFLRTSPQWALVDRLRRLYSPVFCDSRTCYAEGFIAGFSAAGDPCF